ncbi:hypothetical protein OBBRIDRAFT_807533 [Obba rivulosa]|uniref:F-box domain-containing protein n=1 Tax=Obba rivulosa TaxID=1052685 RepID=A0A8E2ARM7_9APHY|nr:hypothetical protein OBBRIDRAFT_807533 [Obba rivulosa]
MSRRRKAQRTLRSGTMEVPGVQHEPVRSAEDMRLTDVLGALLNLNQNAAGLELLVDYTRIRNLKYIWPQVVVECKDLVPVTEVCRYWRQVVLGNPFLWSHINSFIPEIILERSRGVPLHVYVDIEMNLELVKQLVEDRRPFSAFYGRCPGHSLETLELVSARDELVFEGSTPRLRELVLYGTLVRLCLLSIDDIPFSKLHSWLSASPCLQELILSSLELDIDGENLEVVHLGHMQRLTVSDISDDSAQHFLDYITVGDSIAMQIFDTPSPVMPRKSTSRRFDQLHLEHTSRLFVIGQSSGAYIQPQPSSPEEWHRVITQGINVDDIRRLPTLDNICHVILDGLAGSSTTPIFPKLSCLRIMATAKEVDGSLLGRLYC